VWLPRAYGVYECAQAQREEPRLRGATDDPLAALLATRLQAFRIAWREHGREPYIDTLRVAALDEELA
jgi:hypothetical protein